MAQYLSDAVRKTKELAKGKNYALAATKTLRSMGFSNPHVRVRVAIIVNDINASESDSLLTAVTKALGKEGASVSRERSRQAVFAFEESAAGIPA